MDEGMEPESDKIKTAAAVASAVAAVLMLAVVVIRLTVEKPEGAVMLIDLLIGATGALVVVSAFLWRRWYGWTNALNKNWPLAKSVLFSSDGETADNLFAVVGLSAVNIAPVPTKIAAPEDVTVSVVGVGPVPVKIEVGADVSAGVLDPTLSFRVGFTVAGAPQPFRGTVRFRQPLARPGSSDVIEPYEIPFLVEVATPGFKQVSGDRGRSGPAQRHR